MGRHLWRLTVLCLAVLLLCTGCSSLPEAQDPHPEWDPAWCRVAGNLAVETPEGFVLSEQSDAMAGMGIYYASWTAGEGRSVTNAEGQSATAWEAQIFVLVKGHETAEAAETDIADWLEREAAVYEAGPESSWSTAGGVTFRLLPLHRAGESNPYQRGAAAFALHGTDAVSVELLCTGEWQGEAEEALRQFLTGFHFGD